MRGFGRTYLGLTCGLALLAGALVSGHASAASSHAPGALAEVHPPQVQAVLDEARKACRDAEGQKVTFGPNAVRRLDLTGHGRTDYIVDMNDATCDAAESLYCGTGGCELTILTKPPGGTLTRVFEGRVLKYDVLPERGADRGAKRIRFRLHGSYCGKAGTDYCAKTRKIGGKVFGFKQPG